MSVVADALEEEPEDDPVPLSRLQLERPYPLCGKTCLYPSGARWGGGVQSAGTGGIVWPQGLPDRFALKERGPFGVAQEGDTLSSGDSMRF